jgi:hypothetical protein
MAGQNGNGDFVYKDKWRMAKAQAMMEAANKELFKKANGASEAVFNGLKHPIDQDEFLTIVDNTYYVSNVSGIRVIDHQAEILMMDYKDCGDGLLGKCIMVYAPMFVALMFMEDEVAAKKFFQIELIHEVLHYFSYSEDEAEETAPLLYKRLF